MATIFKTLLNNDVAMTRTLLNEAIPITGSIVSGTYNDENVKKNYAHGMFESVYDYPYLSSSANHIFDITYGYSSVHSGAYAMNAKKMNIYNQIPATRRKYGKPKIDEHNYGILRAAVAVAPRAAGRARRGGSRR